MLVGVNEGVLPFKSDDEAMTAERLAEERRLMYVGITRAQKTLLVSTLKRRKRGRDGFVAATPSRFIAEMKLEEQVPKENPLDRIKRLKAALGASSAPSSPSAPSAPAESSPGAPNTGDHRAHV
jgi:ATP-dependent DNA helicase Rep